MPPKKQDKNAAGGGGKKTSVEDRTFGMKNKKGAQAQKQIQQMQKNLNAGGTPEEKKKAADKAQREKEKKAAEDAKREMDLLMNKPTQVQKVPFGVDPKTVMCIFYKKGNCEKGKKCKFSHDPTLDRKTDKKGLYTDKREDEEEKKKAETSADWDEEELRKVVLSKKGNQRTSTEKVCKFFVSAIEDGKYGWFWICPNGGDQCMYRHALPPGLVNTRQFCILLKLIFCSFVLKTKEQRAAEKALLDKSPLKTLTLEDFLETERHKLTGTLTPVTPESFAKWKAERQDKKAAEEQARKAKETTGRDLFESGKWANDGDSDDDEDDGAWNLEKMRKETEAIHSAKEEERLMASYAKPEEQASAA